MFIFYRFLAERLRDFLLRAERLRDFLLRVERLRDFLFRVERATSAQLLPAPSPAARFLSLVMAKLVLKMRDSSTSRKVGSMIEGSASTALLCIASRSTRFPSLYAFSSSAGPLIVIYYKKKKLYREVLNSLR